MSTINTLPPQGGGVVRVEDYLPWTADEFPPGTFDGFTHEMLQDDVRQAARDAAIASVSRWLGRLTASGSLDVEAAHGRNLDAAIQLWVNR